MALRGKKGQTGFFGSLQMMIQSFIESAPMPMKIAVFLFFLLFLGWLFGLLVNTTGHYCDTNGNLYSTGFFSVFTNIDLLINMPSQEDLKGESINPNYDYSPLIGRCSKYFSGYDYYNGSDRVNITDGYYFVGYNTRCVTCPNDFVFAEKISAYDVCLGNVYLKNSSDMSWWSRQVCGNDEYCAPPAGFYYDKTSNSFMCQGDICNGTTVGDLWNKKLLQKGALLKPASDFEQQDYRNFITLSCDRNEVDPKIKVFGIDIFNYKLWLLLIVLAILVYITLWLKR